MSEGKLTTSAELVRLLNARYRRTAPLEEWMAGPRGRFLPEPPHDSAVPTTEDE